MTVADDEEDEVDGPLVTRHYFYFAERPPADALAAELKGFGFEVEVDWSPPGGRWLVLATHMATADETLDLSFHRMETLAERFGGDYDGHEIELRRWYH